MVTFRWSVYNPTDITMAMLKASIKSFKKYFPQANYIISSDDDICIEGVTTVPNSGYFAKLPKLNEGSGLYRKWAPFRYSDDVEIHIDYDIFAIRYPRIIDMFIEDENKVFLVQSRTEGDLNNRSGYGEYAHEIHPQVPPCCVGFVGSKPELPFDERYLIPHYWRAIKNRAGWFCEQGAIIKEMEQLILDGKTLLATEEYIRYGHPRDYVLPPNCDTDMVHLIYSRGSNYRYFREMFGNEEIERLFQQN